MNNNRQIDQLLHNTTNEQLEDRIHVIIMHDCISCLMFLNMVKTYNLESMFNLLDINHIKFNKVPQILNFPLFFKIENGKKVLLDVSAIFYVLKNFKTLNKNH